MRPSSQLLRAKLGVKRRGGLSSGLKVFFYFFFVNLLILLQSLKGLSMPGRGVTNVLEFRFRGPQRMNKNSLYNK